MLKSLLPAPWLALGAVLVLGAATGASYLKGRADGRSALEARLMADRVQILKDGKDITDEVLDADDAGLCELLGGCELPE